MRVGCVLEFENQATSFPPPRASLSCDTLHSALQTGHFLWLTPCWWRCDNETCTRHSVTPGPCSTRVDHAKQRNTHRDTVRDAARDERTSRGKSTCCSPAQSLGWLRSGPSQRVSTVQFGLKSWKERECCLLVLNLVSSTLPCIRRPSSMS